MEILYILHGGSRVSEMGWMGGGGGRGSTKTGRIPSIYRLYSTATRNSLHWGLDQRETPTRAVSHYANMLISKKPARPNAKPGKPNASI